ncbi:MAG TPA: hypothetical protein VEQ42_01225 [Pyrinomonadaceae bacterium]|nr:hypothetical protein [Pyrinomonadaceae bacterium]
MRPLSGPSAFDIPKGYRPVSAESAERELGVLLEILRGTRDADR